jgi:hypothetical protein
VSLAVIMLTLVIALLVAAPWSLIHFGKIKVSSPSGTTAKKTPPKTGAGAEPAAETAQETLDKMLRPAA